LALSVFQGLINAFDMARPPVVHGADGYAPASKLAGDPEESDRNDLSNAIASTPRWLMWRGWWGRRSRAW